MRRRNPWVLARLRLFGWYVRFNEEPPRGGRARPEVGDRAGGGNGQCTAPGRSDATRSATVWGKPLQPLVAQGGRCYVARSRPADGRPVRLPRCVTARPGRDPRSTCRDDLHTCGRACGQPTTRTTRAVAKTVPLTADDIWDQGSATLRDQLAPATWAAWFHGVRPLSYDGDDPAPERAELAGRRAHPLQLLRACSPTPSATPPASTVRVELLVETAPKERESIALAPPPVSVVVDARRRPVAWRRRSDDTDDEADRHLGLGHAEHPLHLRPVRHRGLQPLRPRRRALRGREPGPVLQPAVHLRPRRVWARPTSSTPSGTTSARCSATSGCGTSPPRRS